MSQARSTRQISEEVTVAVVCDGCGKRVNINPPTRSYFTPEGWTHFDSSHGEWGTDSGDSYDEHDVCSWACYVTVVRRVGERHRFPPSLRIDGKNVGFIRSMLDTTKETT